MTTERAIQEYELEETVAAYWECAFWSSSDQSDESGGESLEANYSVLDLDKGNRARVEQEIYRFILDNAPDFKHWSEGANSPEESAAQFGHDLWLTRNHHGAGFWDRGRGELGERLTEAAHKMGEQNLYVGDDGHIYVEGF